MFTVREENKIIILGRGERDFKFFCPLLSASRSGYGVARTLSKGSDRQPPLRRLKGAGAPFRAAPRPSAPPTADRRRTALPLPLGRPKDCRAGGYRQASKLREKVFISGR